MANSFDLLKTKAVDSCCFGLKLFPCITFVFNERASWPWVWISRPSRTVYSLLILYTAVHPILGGCRREGGPVPSMQSGSKEKSAISSNYLRRSNRYNSVLWFRHSRFPDKSIEENSKIKKKMVKPNLETNFLNLNGKWIQTIWIGFQECLMW